jgi:hypothetical protein
MAGTLTISTLSDGTNSTSATNPILGSAKAWVNFNGSTAAIKASFNVSSVTRTATGFYTINFTNAFSDANYACLVTSTYGSANNFVGTAPTTTAAAIQAFNSTTGVGIDSLFISASFLR